MIANLGVVSFKISDDQFGVGSDGCRFGFFFQVVCSHQQHYRAGIQGEHIFC